MVSLESPCWNFRRTAVFSVCTLAALLGLNGLTSGARLAKLEILHIGSSGGLTSEKGGKEKAALETLQGFIKEETGLDNDITRQKDWRQLADKLAKGQLQLGVFQGYEFAWAQEKQADLKPLAVAVNVNVYPSVFVVARKKNKAKDFAGLQGQSLSIPATGQGYLRLYVERRSAATGKKIDAFFSKVTAPDNVEDALDEVVDGKVQATAVDRAAAQSYAVRKPGRFKQLKAVDRSKLFPPVVVAYYGNNLDEATRNRFKDGLLEAAKKEKGQMMLTLFKLTKFAKVPDDFNKVLADTRKAYPPSGATK